jgi:hypothetical protein
MSLTNRLVSALLALALTISGVVVAVEIVLAGLDRPTWVLSWPSWYRWTLHHTWSDAAIKATAFGACVLGATLLIVAALHHRTVAFEDEGGRRQTTTTVPRSNLAASLRRSAEALDGVVAARVRISPRKVRVRARPNRKGIDGLEDAVARAVTGQLLEFGPAQLPDVTVRLAATTS